MLTISSKCIYGVHALFELALSYGKSPMNIREIARAQGIPEDYLRQLLLTLKRAGLVESTRGVEGGYNLAKPPPSITVREIIENLEGPLKTVDATPGEEVLKSYWNKCTEDIKNIFDTTLGELVVEKQRVDKNITYYI